jgi:predicted nucleotidyltransferase
MMHPKTVAEETGLGPDSTEARWAIREVKAFLDLCRQSIHSLILFGSYAFGKATPGSDIDFLVLLKSGKESRRLRKILFDFKIALGDNPQGETPVEIQVVDLDEQEIEQIFELSTPLAHALRHGVIIRDDGWFHELLRRPYPGWPTKEAAVVAFTRWIVWQYYRCAIDLKREIDRDHGPEGICTQNGECIGHFSGDILARVISRMLYVTLPERGFLPLCKIEAEKMALKAYGLRANSPVELAMNVLRNDRAVTDGEFSVMMPFARRLFRECFIICGRKNMRVIEALRHQASIYKELRKREINKRH